MFLEYFRITTLAMAQIFILGLAGYFLVKRNILSHEGLSALSRIVVQVIFPALIFSQLIKNFAFSLYPQWWIFPLISLAITIAGLGIGALCVGAVKNPEVRTQFLSLIAFQNSGYLPLAIAAAMFSGEKLNAMFIYIFLFLLGFDLVMWSLGIHLLTRARQEKFKLASIFSAPVIANLFSLGLIFFGLPKFIPAAVLAPLQMTGNCTLPLAMFVVGGNIALIHLRQVNTIQVLLISAGKLIALPAIGLGLVLLLRLPELLGLLIIMQLAMPSATSLSVIIRHYRKEDSLVSQGVFFTHVFSLLTIPLFLSLYLALTMVK